MELTDEALMAAYQKGDKSALEPLVRRYANPLLGYLIRMTRNREQAEDVFQETFIRVHKKARSFRGKGRFKSWLYSIATHCALDSLRRRKRDAAVVSLDADPVETGALIEKIPNTDPRPDDEAVRSDQATKVREALDVLPPRQRATLVLAYFQGLSYREVAASLGCSVGTVKTQMSRALRTLAKALPDIGAEYAKGGAA